MAVRKVVYYPETCLKQPSRDLRPEELNAQLDELIADMFETMYAYEGVGLAAPQIGINLRLSVIDTGEDSNNKHVLINPKIVEVGETELKSEGCLSVPGHFHSVPRATELTVRRLNRDGQEVEQRVTGFLAHVMHHEIDHLDGKLFIDYLSPLKRKRIREKMIKSQRQAT